MQFERIATVVFWKVLDSSNKMRLKQKFTNETFQGIIGYIPNLMNFWGIFWVFFGNLWELFGNSLENSLGFIELLKHGHFWTNYLYSVVSIKRTGSLNYFEVFYHPVRSY